MIGIARKKQPHEILIRGVDAERQIEDWTGYYDNFRGKADLTHDKRRCKTPSACGSWIPSPHRYYMFVSRKSEPFVYSRNTHRKSNLSNGSGKQNYSYRGSMYNR